MEKEILKRCIEKGFLIDKESINILKNYDEESVFLFLKILFESGFFERIITRKTIVSNSRFLFERIGKSEHFEKVLPIFYSFGCYFDEKKDEKKIEESGKVKLLLAPAFKERKIEVSDFVNHFRYRYNAIKKIFEKSNIENLSTIKKIGDNEGSYSIIGAVLSKRQTKNRNLLLEVEDMSGRAFVLVNQNKKEVFEKAKSLLVDDIVCFLVGKSKDMFFANDILFPDCFLEEKRYGDREEYVAFSGDVHVGSTMFLERNFLKFIKWLNGEEGDLYQREIAKKVKYLFLVGDNIDGVNHYPGQERYLVEKTSFDQYKKLEELLKLIREDIKIIICPGQHDSVWIGEPQPIISEKFAPGLHKMKNVFLVPNPSTIEIDFGFKILMYHGASINQFIEEMSEIRVKYGHKRPVIVLKEMLKRRHLAPIHGSVDYIPCEREDPLVISIVPDILVSADQHRPEIGLYNNILLISVSCWQSITPFEEKVGNVPDPCKVPLFNLKTREIKIFDFSEKEEERPKEIKWEEDESLYCLIKDCPKNKKCIIEKSCLEVSR